MCSGSAVCLCNHERILSLLFVKITWPIPSCRVLGELMSGRQIIICGTSVVLPSGNLHLLRRTANFG
jgi:hypothetical protein